MKKLLRILLVLFLCLSLSACGGSETPDDEKDNQEQKDDGEKESGDPIDKEEKKQVPGIISLDNECNLKYSKQAYEVEYNGYKFELYDTNEYKDGYVSLSKGGYFLNTTPFGDIDSFEVEYSIEAPEGTEKQDDLGFGSLYYVTDTHLITSPRSYERVEVQNDTLVTLTDDPNYIAFYTFNEIEIKSITINYSTEKQYTEVFTNFDIQLIATNDMHGQVNSDDSHAGLENASGYIEEEKKTTKYNILLDQGDIYQGSLACYLTEGHVEDDFLLMNGYDSTILGNHEWDWMEENIVEHREYSPEVKLLACNVRYKDGSTPSWVENYYITERGGVQIGVIGALGDIAGDISADMIENIMFVTGDELATMITTFSKELKEKGCDYIILQLHQGSTYSGISEEVKEVEYTELDYSKLKGKVDLVLESHSHKAYYHVDKYGITHVQCGGYLSALGDLTLEVTFEGSTPTVSIKDCKFAYATELMKYDSEFFSEVNEWYSEKEYKEESERVVATMNKDYGDTEINQLAANAYYALKDVYSELSSYDICLGGGHIACRSPKTISKGNVTMSDITNLFPFDNDMYLVKIAGKDLKYNFLNKNGYYYDGIYNKDSILDFNKEYYIIIDSYNFFYLTKQLKTPANVTMIINLTEKYNIHPRETLAMYLNSNYPIKDCQTVELNKEFFDYSKETLEVNLKDGLKVTINYSNIEAVDGFDEFNVKKSAGVITITVSEGYKITGVDIKQYTIHKNLTFYSDSECKNEISYSVPQDNNNPSYTLTNDTNTFVIKNISTYDLKVFFASLTIEKTK